MDPVHNITRYYFNTDFIIITGLCPHIGLVPSGLSEFIKICIHVVWVPVTTAWRFLRSRMEAKASRFGRQLRIYCISSRVQPTRGDDLASGLDEGPTTPHHFSSLLRNVTQWFEIERILQNDQENEKKKTFGTWNVRSLYRTSSLKTVSSELAKYEVGSSGSARGQMGWVWQSANRRLCIFLRKVGKLIIK